MLSSDSWRFIVVFLAFFMHAIASAQEPTEKLSRLDQIYRNQFGSDFPVGDDPKAGVSIEARIQQNPNDAFAIRKNTERVRSAFDRRWAKLGQQTMADPSSYAKLKAECAAELSVKIRELEEFTEQLPGATASAKSAIKGVEVNLDTMRQMRDQIGFPLEVFETRLKNDPMDIRAISLLGEKASAEICVAALHNVEHAQALLVRVKQTIKHLKSSLPPDDPDSNKRRHRQDFEKVRWMGLQEAAQVISPRFQLERAKNRIADAESQFQVQNSLVKQIGKDVLPMGPIDAWVNGEPLTDGNLKGKILLVSFWYPQDQSMLSFVDALNGWKERFGKQLTVVGLTAYINYTWDAETKRPKRISRSERLVPKEEERSMWTDHASVSGMSFPVGVCDYNKVFQEFTSTYFPPGGNAMLLVDQVGKVHMIQIVHGDRDLKTIEKAIASLAD